MINLISNANKFSPDGDKIELTVNMGRPSENGDTIEIKVEDHGIGIAKNDITKVFQPFSRIKDRQNLVMNPIGNGIGLSISQKIAKTLGGGIKIESELGVGTIFTFTFPATRVNDNLPGLESIDLESGASLFPVEQEGNREHFEIMRKFGKFPEPENFPPEPQV